MEPSDLRLQFLEDLYCRLEEPLVLVTGPAKGPFHFWLTSEIDKMRLTQAEYFRVCPLRFQPAKGRGTQRESACLPGVWIDIDVGDKGNGKRYFPDLDTAVKFSKDYVPVSHLVGSGTGLHGYVAFTQPFMITNDEQFNRAYAASFRFQQWFRERCGYDIDSTHDLARFMRLPGSMNRSRLVEVLFRKEPHLDIEWVESLPVERTVPAACSTTSVYTFALDPHCHLNWGVMENLLAANETFRQTWFGDREPTDRSPSGKRFSMLSFLLQMGLDVQDAVDITIRFLIDRCKFLPSQLKLDRPEVWSSEIAKIQVRDFTPEDFEAVVQSDDRAKKIETIAALMEFPEPERLQNVARYKVMASDDTIVAGVIQLHILTLDGKTEKVQLTDPLSRARSIDQIFNETGVALPRYSGKKATEPAAKWVQAMQLAYQVAEVYSPVESMTTEVLLNGLKSYVHREGVCHSIEEAKETGRPFIDNGLYIVPTAQFYALLRVDSLEMRNNREVHAAIRELERTLGRQVKYTSYGGTKLSCLVVPVPFLDTNSGV